MEKNLFLIQLYEELKLLQLVDNQYDFSVLCGRTPAWFSTLKSRRLPMTTDAALTLSLSIQNLATSLVDAAKYEAALALSDALLKYAHARVSRKLQLQDLEWDR